MHFSYKSACQAFIISFLSASLSACLVGPDFKSAPAPQVKHYTESPWTYRTVSTPGKAGISQHFIRGANVPPQWWRAFHSKKLNTLVCRGLANSPNLAAAKAALRQAEQNLSAGAGSLYPAFSLQLSAQRGSSTGTFNSNLGDTNITASNVPLGGILNLFNAAVNVSYLLDVFGGTRREIEALKAQVDYQDYEWKAVYLTLVGNIVTSTIALASLETQIRVTRQLILEQEEQLHIIKAQFNLGSVSGIDVLSQQTQVAQTRATLPPLEKSKDQTRHTLAVLVGSLPSASCIPTIDLSELNLPARLPLSIPSALVRHRPDVLAAEALWKAANAQVGVATANLYPQFSINGTYGRSNPVGSNLLGSQSKIWSIGSGLLQPLFRGGTLVAQRRAAIAAYDQAGAQYQQVVLQAFKNVADTLRALEADARELRAQKQAEVAASTNLYLTRQQFKLGGINYLSLLDAQRQYQQTRISFTQAQASRYADTAALYQALGGGWWNC